MPARNIIMAMVLMACITFRLKLVGRFGSFLRKKYMNKFIKKEGSPSTGKPSEYLKLMNIIFV